MCGGVGSGVSRRWRAARRDESGAVSPRTAPRPVSASADTQSGCGPPPCLQSDSAVDSSASARRARACPSVEAGLWFAPPGPPEPVSSNAGPHRTEPSFTQVQSLLELTRPVVRGCQSLERRLIVWRCRVLRPAGLPPEPLSSTSRASPGSPARFRSAPLSPPKRELATRLSGPKDAAARVT